jgi:hypothetical protein
MERPPVVRAQMEDEPAPAPRPAQRHAALLIPTPEELGVGDARATPAAVVDWAEVHGRLDRLGVTCFQLEKLASAGCRVSCLLPTGQDNRAHRIEVEATSEAEAVRLALAKAGEWADGR